MVRCAKVFFKSVWKAVVFVIARVVGRVMYSNAYFPKGCWFETWKSVGYEWVLSDFWGRFLLRKNRGIPWPVSPYCNVSTKHILFDKDDLNNFQSLGTYYQAWDANIVIGKGTYIAQGVGIITSNHDIYDLNKRGKIADVVIGEQCWIGMNSVLLPGVKLGNHTVVGAGAVVTKSFEEGFCIVAGNPAKVIKRMDGVNRADGRNVINGSSVN